MCYVRFWAKADIGKRHIILRVIVLSWLNEHLYSKIPKKPQKGFAFYICDVFVGGCRTNYGEARSVILCYPANDMGKYTCP